MSKEKSIIKFNEVIIAYFITLFSFASAYFIRVLGTRRLSPEDFGLIYFLISVSSFIILLSRFGLTSSFIYFYERFRKRREEYVKFMLSFSILVFFLSILILILAHNKIMVLFKIESSQIFSLFLLFVLANYIYGTFNPFMLLKIDVIRTKLAEFVRLFIVAAITTLLFFNNGLNTITFFLAWIAGMAVAALYTLQYFIKNFGWTILKESFNFRDSLFKNKKIGKDLFYYGFFLISTQFFGFLFSFLDSFLITIALGTALFSYYNLSYSLLTIPRTLFASFASFFYPISSKLGKKSYNYVREVIKLITFFSLIISGFFMAFSKDIVILLFSKNYLPTAQVLFVFSPFILFMVLFPYFLSSLIGEGLAKKANLIYVIGFIIDLILNLIVLLSPLPNMTKVQLIALATGIGWATVCFIGYYVLLKQYNLSFISETKENFKYFVKVIILVLISLIPALWIKQNYNFGIYLNIAVFGLVTGSIYLVLSYIFQTIPKPIRSRIDKIIISREWLLMHEPK